MAVIPSSLGIDRSMTITSGRCAVAVRDAGPRRHAP
jgi:hypothetical protein